MTENQIQEEVCEERLVRHAGDESEFPMSKAFTCASCGLRYAFSTQRNFRVHLFFAILAIVLGFLLQIPPSSWLAVILCIGAVFSLEVVNTAIESIVDMASPGWHELAMRAKDCAAGAVLIAAITSLVIAAVVYIPQAVILFSSFLA